MYLLLSSEKYTVSYCGRSHCIERVDVTQKSPALVLEPTRISGVPVKRRYDEYVAPLRVIVEAVLVVQKGCKALLGVDLDGG